MSAAITLNGVSKSYRLYTERRQSLRERFVHLSGNKHEDFWALRDISFAIEPGETFGIVGHNGSGKSTLLKLMAGIHRPTSGTVTTRGRVGALLELGAGFNPELTGRENVRLNAAILGLPRSYIDKRMDDIVEFAGVERFFDSPVSVYSTGMITRLGFATAVHVEPDVLLVDEAIAVGDEEFQRRCMDHMHRLRTNGTTIVLVSHALSLVADLCDRATWIDHGRQQMTGPAETVIDAYLTDVNRKLADAQYPGALPERVHLGSGEIRINDVEFVDSAGAGGLTTGEPCTIRLRYDATTAMSDITFGLGFISETGVRVAGPNSGHGAAAIDVAAGQGVAEFHVDHLILQPGRYRVSAAAVSRQHVVDHVEAGYDLTVTSAHAVTEPGLIRMPGRWSLSSGGQ